MTYKKENLGVDATTSEDLNFNKLEAYVKENTNPLNNELQGNSAPWEKQSKGIPLNFDRRSIQSAPVYTDPTDALLEFTKVLEQAGLIMTGLPDASGKIIRTKTVDGKGKDGWYVCFSGEIFGGAYGNFKTGLEGKWSSVEPHSMSAAQIAEHQRKMKVAKEQSEKVQQAIYEEAAKEASQIWNSGKIVHEFPYLSKKKLSAAVHLSQSEGNYYGCMMLPLYDEYGDISSLQFIKGNGEKRFLTGGRKRGCYHLIEGEIDAIYVCEGWATGQTLNLATGSTIAVAFDSGNLLPVTENVRAKFPNSSLVIAGDDDHEKDVNVGRTKAEAVAATLGLRAVFPDCSVGESDFNDIGVERTKKAIEYRPKVYKHAQSNNSMPSNLLNPPGILREIVNYYNATARAPQPGFAVQTALALGSLICARRFRSTKGNFTSMYFLNVAKSGTGKEHVKTCLDNLLEACGKSGLMNGSGYTSAGAIFSSLLRTPRHLTIIDEFGRYLSASNSKGNSSYQEANTQLMEAIGRLDGTMRPSSYSTMTLTKDKVQEMVDRKIRNPAITLTALTTPSTFLESISSNNVSDGFLGRFIVHISNQERVVHDDKDWVDVPQAIVDWSDALDNRFPMQSPEVPEDSPAFAELSFDQKSMQILQEFDQERVDLCNKLESVGLEALPGRSKEMAMRMAMIVALAEDPQAIIVGTASTSWAIQYVRFALQEVIKLTKYHVADSIYEKEYKKVLDVIRSAGGNGINRGNLLKRAPLRSLNKKQREEILSDLQDRGLIRLEDRKLPQGGRPTTAYYSIELDD